MAGYIKMYRKLRDWRWYGVPAVKDTFIELLLTAKFEDGAFKGVEIKRGQAVFSYDGLSQKLGLSVKQIRNAIQKLRQTGEIEYVTNRHISIATIINYDEYHDDERADKGQTKGRQRADKGQTKGNIQECKEGEERMKNIKKKSKLGSVYATETASFDVNKYERESMFDD